MLKEKAKFLVRDCLPPIVLRFIESFHTLIAKKSHSSKSGKEQSSFFYDRTFLNHNHWCRHYTLSRYFPIWTVIASWIWRSGVTSIIDIGCGPGQVAQLLHDKGIQKYLGIDFSTERIKQARIVSPEFDFKVANVFETDLLSKHDYDGVVCLEFLEHVEKDKQVLEKLRPGTLFWGSVPNFGCKQHVRHFNNTIEVIQRYGDYFNDFMVDEYIINTNGTKFFVLEGITKSFTCRL